MQHYEKEIIPEKEVATYTHTTCDLCGKDVEEHLDSYAVDEVTVKREYGNRYPDGGNVTTIEVDICGPCFATKLGPWLESQGVKPVKKEVWF